MENIRKKYNAIDITKFLLAIIVIFNHTVSIKEFNLIIQEILNILMKAVVPFFFIASGFLLGKKIIHNPDKEKEIIIEYIKKALKTYILWTIIYLPITIYGWKVYNFTIMEGIVNFIKNFIFRGENYYSWPLWYMLGTVYAGIIYFLIYKVKRIKNKSLIIAFVFFAVSIIVNLLISNKEEFRGIIYSCINIIEKLIASGRILSGVAYTIIGTYIARNNTNLAIIKSIILLLIGILLEVILPSYINEMGVLIYVVMMFLIILNIKLKDNKVYLILRKNSTIIYFIHMIICFIYTLIFREFPYYGLDQFIFVTVISLIIANIIILLDKEEKVFKKVF